MCLFRIKIFVANFRVKMVVPIDGLVHSVSLYISLPLIFHGYIFPYIIAYSGLLWYCWLSIDNVNESFEFEMIMLAAIGCLQILTCLCCHWSVHIRCMLTCKEVGSPYYSIFIIFE